MNFQKLTKAIDKIIKCVLESYGSFLTISLNGVYA